MFHILYKTTNLINGKFYIGKHSTDNLSDNYLGSGKLLTKAIIKYGQENFSREIINYYNDATELNEAERSFITLGMILDSNCYNISFGGLGGNLGPIVNELISINTSKALRGKTKSVEHRRALSEAKLGKIVHTPNSKSKISHTVKQNWAKLTSEERRKKFGHFGRRNGFFGKSHSVETIAKIRQTIGSSRANGLNANAKAVVIDGIYFSSMKEAMQELKINRNKLIRKIEGELKSH